MRVVQVDQRGVREDSYSGKKAIKFMHELAERYFSNVRRFTIDMDGVLIHDDNAIMAARTVSTPDAQDTFKQYADLNIKAVAEGQTSYCWYAPTVFVGQLLKGLSPEINRVVGQNMRLIPGAIRFVDYSKELGYDLTAVTAGHQEAAEEVSLRLGIERTIGTQLGISNGLYDGTVKRFIGGFHKLKFVREVIGDDGQGTHIGDSYSDVETLEEVSNSIAFNPGCDPALRNANLSLIGTSLSGLIPFFDYRGRYDREVNEEELPRTLILIESLNEPVMQRLLEESRLRQELVMRRLVDESRDVKKIELEEILTREQGPRILVEEKIKQRLRELGIDFHTKSISFMPLSVFDRYAKEAYARLE